MPTAPSLIRIEFEGLFGQKNGRINLNRKRPTILTGTNGSGKSTLLRLVSAASANELRTLYNAPLRSFRMSFDGLPDFVLRRGEDGVRISWAGNHGFVSFDRGLESLPLWAWQGLADADPSVEGWEDQLGDAARSQGVRYPEFRSVRDRISAATESGDLFTGPDWLAEFRASFPVTFVTDQRLVAETPRGEKANPIGGSRPSRLAVEEASRHLLRQLSQADSSYARASQEIDRDLPQAILNTMALGGRLVDEQALFELILATDEKRSALLEVGLLDPGSATQTPLLANFDDPSVRLAMTVVIEAALRKLAVLEPLERKLTAMKDFLDERFGPKSLVVSRQDGLQFMLPDGNVIRPSQLSSGEQQMLVLAWEILFRAKAGTLVIVDEPEISLHVLWQDTLIRDLEQMGQAAEVSFLMATHSPMIVAAAPELERSLDELAL